MRNKFTNVYLEILNDATISENELSSVFFWGKFPEFLSRWFIAFH